MLDKVGGESLTGWSATERRRRTVRDGIFRKSHRSDDDSLLDIRRPHQAQGLTPNTVLGMKKKKHREGSEQRGTRGMREG